MAEYIPGSRSTISIDNTGFSPNSSAEGARLTNKDGRINLRETGVPFYERISVYHSLLRMNQPTFILTVFGIYTSLNISFAAMYYLIGIEKLAGTATTNIFIEDFLQAFFSVPKPLLPSVMAILVL